MATWVYDPATAIYRQPSGRKLSTAQLLDVRNAIADGFEEEVGLLVAAWFAGTMSFAEWTLAFGALITAGVTAGYLLGYGGKAAVDDHSTKAIDSLILAQIVYANKFITDVGESMLSDSPMSQAAMTARAKLYAGSPVLSFEQGQAAAQGATSLPYMPADGHTACNSRCRCWWSYENINATETHAYWHTQEDGAVCPGCLEREAESDPFVLTPQINIRGLTPTSARRIPLLKQPDPYPTKPSKPTLEPSDVE